MQSKLISLLLAFFVATLFSPGGNAAAAEKGKPPVVIAALIYTKNNLPTWEGFKLGMKERGYIEGENVRYLFPGPVEKIEELDAAMAALTAKNPDLIYACPTPGALAAKKATQDKKIPVLFGPVNDPVVAGIVKEYQHPGGNITGVMLPESEGRRLQWLTEIVPGVKTILLPYNPNDKSSTLSFQNIQDAAATLHLKVVVKEVRTPAEIDTLLAQFPEGIDAIVMTRDGMIMTKVKEFAALAIKRKLPITGQRLEMTQNGALFSYGFDGFEVGRQVSRLAELIIKGKSPGDLPVETAQDFLAINLKTAAALGRTIDDHILRQARHVIRPE